MSFLFGSKPQSSKEFVREQQRALKKNERGLDREQRDLQTREQKLINDIKKASKEGNPTLANTLAKQLIRLRQTSGRTAQIKGHLQGISSQMSVACTQNTLATSLGGAAKAMGVANKQMDPAALNKIINQFATENDIMDGKQEIMDDTFDDIFDEEGLGTEADAITAEVLAEIGLEFQGKMAVAPPRRAVVAQPQEDVAAAGVQEEDEDAALMRRLQALK